MVQCIRQKGKVRPEGIFLMSTQLWGEGFLKNIIVFNFLHSSLAGTFHLSVKAKGKNTPWSHFSPIYRHMSQIHKFPHNHKLPQKTCVISGVLFFHRSPKNWLLKHLLLQGHCCIEMALT